MYSLFSIQTQISQFLSVAYSPVVSVLVCVPECDRGTAPTALMGLTFVTRPPCRAVLGAGPA